MSRDDDRPPTFIESDTQNIGIKDSKARGLGKNNFQTDTEDANFRSPDKKNKRYKQSSIGETNVDVLMNKSYASEADEAKLIMKKFSHKKTNKEHALTTKNYQRTSNMAPNLVNDLRIRKKSKNK